MKPDVLILFTRHDTANADFVDSIRSTLDAAGMASQLSESAGPGAAERARLCRGPRSPGYGLGASFAAT